MEENEENSKKVKLQSEMIMKRAEKEIAKKFDQDMEKPNGIVFENIKIANEFHWLVHLEQYDFNKAGDYQPNDEKKPENSNPDAIMECYK